MSEPSKLKSDVIFAFASVIRFAQVCTNAQTQTHTHTKRSVDKAKFLLLLQLCCCCCFVRDFQLTLSFSEANYTKSSSNKLANYDEVEALVSHKLTECEVGLGSRLQQGITATATTTTNIYHTSTPKQYDQLTSEQRLSSTGFTIVQ